MTNDTGILVTNIGSPDAPTPQAVRSYLKEFLSDKRVVNLPRFIWCPILYGYILPFRSKSSAKLYKKIWTENGSPLIVLSKKLTEKLQHHLQIPVALGMHYGKPSIKEATHSLQQQGIKRIIVLPLFPQYSATTTEVTFDLVKATIASWTNKPELTLINNYHDNPEYINALCQSIQKYWQTHGKPQHLLFSFHGIPKRNCDLGDPYEKQCRLTAELVATQLGLEKSYWTLAFQSRLGRAKWLEPYTNDVLAKLPQQGITNLHVACPGFAVDCLETLEEIIIRGNEQFIDAGGKEFHYIPALNDSDAAVELITSLCQRKLASRK